jgi:hypothetical protein
MSFNTEHFDVSLAKIPIGENYKEGIDSLLKMLAKNKNVHENLA